jgi:hypothetical protein
MNNPVKVVIGTLVGAGIGMAISRALERGSSQPEGVATAAALPAEPKETLRERWERARLAGDAARTEKEAALRSYFRQKVQDPAALRGSGSSD